MLICTNEKARLRVSISSQRTLFYIGTQYYAWGLLEWCVFFRRPNLKLISAIWPTQTKTLDLQRNPVAIRCYLQHHQQITTVYKSLLQEGGAFHLSMYTFFKEKTKYNQNVIQVALILHNRCWMWWYKKYMLKYIPIIAFGYAHCLKKYSVIHCTFPKTINSKVSKRM